MRALSTINLVAHLALGIVDCDPTLTAFNEHDEVGNSHHQYQNEQGRQYRHGIGANQIQQRSEEHTSELQSLMRISYAVFCLKKKNIHTKSITNTRINIIH